MKYTGHCVGSVNGYAFYNVNENYIGSSNGDKEGYEYFDSNENFIGSSEGTSAGHIFYDCDGAYIGYSENSSHGFRFYDTENKHIGSGEISGLGFKFLREFPFKLMLDIILEKEKKIEQDINLLLDSGFTESQKQLFLNSDFSLQDKYKILLSLDTGLKKFPQHLQQEFKNSKLSILEMHMLIVNLDSLLSKYNKSIQEEFINNNTSILLMDYKLRLIQREFSKFNNINSEDISSLSIENQFKIALAIESTLKNYPDYVTRRFYDNQKSIITAYELTKIIKEDLKDYSVSSVAKLAQCSLEPDKIRSFIHNMTHYSSKLYEEFNRSYLSIETMQEILQTVRQYDAEYKKILSVENTSDKLKPDMQEPIGRFKSLELFVGLHQLKLLKGEKIFSPKEIQQSLANATEKIQYYINKKNQSLKELKKINSYMCGCFYNKKKFQLEETIEKLDDKILAANNEQFIFAKVSKYTSSYINRENIVGMQKRNKETYTGKCLSNI